MILQSLCFSFLINDDFIIILFIIIQASLLINPVALLPGATPTLPGAGGVLAGAAPKSSANVLSSSPDSAATGAQAGPEQGVSFDAPVQVTTLPSAHRVRPIFLYLCAFLFLNLDFLVQIICLADSCQNCCTSETTVQSSKATGSKNICSR